jgi:hypothetical protein
VRGLAWPNGPKSYASGNKATGRVTVAGQVEGDGPDKGGYPGPPGWGLGVRLTTSPCKKIIVTKPYDKPRNYDGWVIYKECRISQSQKRCYTEGCMQQDEEEDQK